MNGYVENVMKVVGQMQAERRTEAAAYRQADAARRDQAACRRPDERGRRRRSLTGSWARLTPVARP